MTDSQHSVAYRLGYCAATQAIYNLNERDPFWREARSHDREDIRDAAHPEAFSEALDARGTGLVRDGDYWSNVPCRKCWPSTRPSR
jgi:hypothetical protein